MRNRLQILLKQFSTNFKTNTLVTNEIDFMEIIPRQTF